MSAELSEYGKIKLDLNRRGDVFIDQGGTDSPFGTRVILSAEQQEIVYDFIGKHLAVKRAQEILKAGDGKGNAPQGDRHHHTGDAENCPLCDEIKELKKKFE